MSMILMAIYPEFLYAYMHNYTNNSIQCFKKIYQKFSGNFSSSASEIDTASYGNCSNIFLGVFSRVSQKFLPDYLGIPPKYPREFFQDFSGKSLSGRATDIYPGASPGLFRKFFQGFLRNTSRSSRISPRNPITVL